MATFRDRLLRAQAEHRSTLAVGLAPRLEKMPYPIQRYDDSFLPFGKAIIDATHEAACAYVFDLAAYLSLGASGAIALERTIAYVPAPLIKILHGPFITADYTRAASESAFMTDAVTLATLDPAVISAYLDDPQRGAFVEAEDTARLHALSAQHLGQLGRCQLAGDHRVLMLLDSCPPLRWYTDAITLASRADDFREAARAAAVARQGAF